MSFLTRKYPFPQSSQWFRDCTIYCVIVFLLLYLLQPFGLSMYRGSKLLVSLAFGLVTFVCCALYGNIVFKPLSKIIKVWKIWHQGVTLLAMLIFIGIGNFLLFSYLFNYPPSIYLLGVFLYWTLIIGIIVTIFSIGVSYYQSLRHQLEALLDKTTEEQVDIIITIHDTSIRGKDLQLAINDLLYVEAQKNNVVVCFTKNGNTERAEVHTTLTAVLDDLQAYENIFQCHRSFVVNLNNITSAQGNSNGYQLRLGKCPTVVPVSRTYVPKLRSYIA